MFCLNFYYLDEGRMPKLIDIHLVYNHLLIKHYLVPIHSSMILISNQASMLHCHLSYVKTNRLYFT